MNRTTLGILVASVLVVVGCGGSGDTSELFAGSSTMSAPAVTTTAAAGVTTAAPTSGPSTTVALTTTTLDPDAPPVVLVAPDGWATSADGLAVAELDEDLTGTTHSGYRVLDVTSQELEAYVDEADVVSSVLARDPEVLTIVGFEAMSVMFIEESASAVERMHVTVVVDTGEGTFQVFVFQGSVGTYPDYEATLLDTLQPGR